jgi:hypothetical protein
MATYGFDDVEVEIDAAVGGSLTSLKAYVEEIGDFEIEAILEESHTAGDSWKERLFTGLKDAKEFSLKGFYDDTASTGSNAMLLGIGEVRSFKFTYGGTKTSAFECVIGSYKRLMKRGANHRFEVKIVPTGAVTEA